MGLAGLMAGIGGAAASFGQGMMAGERQKKQDQRVEEDRTYQNEQRNRQRKQWSEQDASTAAIRAADDAGRQAYSVAMAPPEAPADGSGTAARPAMSQDEALLHAMETRTKALADASGSAPGVSNEWFKSFQDTTRLRDQVRGASMDKGWTRYQTSGDVAELARAAYPYLNDGWDLQDAKTDVDENGKKVLRSTRVNRATGEVETNVRPAADIEKAFNYLRDPAKARQLEYESALSDRKNEDMLRRIREQGLNQRGVAELNAGSRERVAGINADSREAAAKIRVDGTITAAQLRATSGGKGGGGKGGGLHFSTKISNADGTTTLVMSDGSHKMLTDDNGTPIIGSKAVDQALGATKIVSGSLGGMSNTPEQNAKAGANMVRGLSDAVRPSGSAPPQAKAPKTVAGKPVGAFWGD
jgi:hypothetical protein